MKLSIIIPTFNACQNHILEENLKTFSMLKDIEIICVDGGSTDRTFELLNRFEVKTLSRKGSRAHLLNEGIKEAKADYLLLVHPRSEISLGDVIEILESRDEIKWGALTHEFDRDHPLLNFTSWYSNHVRGDIFGIFYLDHCIFGEKLLFEQIDYIPEVEIFEDTLLSQKLLKLARPKRLKGKINTSSVRFNKNGVYRQALLNQIMKLAFYMKIDHKKMNKLYEWGLNLNTKSKSNKELVKK
jgi:glycosyltransferase involved in cell wall biosynthesis